MRFHLKKVFWVGGWWLWYEAIIVVSSRSRPPDSDIEIESDMTLETTWTGSGLELDKNSGNGLEVIKIVKKDLLQESSSTRDEFLRIPYSLRRPFDPGFLVTLRTLMFLMSMESTKNLHSLSVL